MANENELIVLSSDESDAPPADSDSSSDTDSSSEEEDDPHPEELTVRGPGVIGHDTYDPHCVFANRVIMDHRHVDSLRDYVAEYEPCIPLYVCTIKDSHVKEQKGKMYFNKKFTNTYLKNYLSTVPQRIRVCGQGWSREVNIKLGSDKQALLTSKWLRVVGHEALGEGDVVIFDFCKANRRLRLFVEKMLPYEDCANP